MLSRFHLRLAGLGVLACCLVMSASNAARASQEAIPGAPKGRLSGEQVRSAVSGKRIYLAVPLGGEIPLYYRTDGRVDGSGDAAGLGRFLRPTDSGRWWVDGDRLCQKWTSWYEGRTFCFTLAKAPGPGQIAWFRDDGQSGIARVGD